MAAHTGVLDLPLLEFPGGDFFTHRDAAQNVFVTGVTGGGKTSGPGHHLLEAMIKSGAGGIVLPAKPGEADEVRALCRKHGRLDSLVVWNGRNHGFNFMSHMLAKLGADGTNGAVENILRTVERVRSASALPGDNGDAIWNDELRRLLRHTVPIVHAATGTLRLADILAFIQTAPTSPEQLADPEWQRQGGFFVRCFAEAATRLDDATGAQMIAFWQSFARLDAKLRGNILTGFSMLDRFNHGWLRDALCGESSLVPELTMLGIILVIDTPRATHGEDGVILQLVVKDAWQHAVLGRNALPTMYRERLVFCYADECQEVVAASDADYLAMSRSSRSSTIYLTQSLAAMYSRIGGANAHDRTHHLIANFGVRIFCANACAETNEWAARTIGKAVQRRGSFNESNGSNVSYGASMGEGTSYSENVRPSRFFGPNSLFDVQEWGVQPGGSQGGGDNLGRNRGHGQNWGTSQGYSEVMDDIIPAGFFARGLKVGGPANNLRVSSVVYQAGRCFKASGGNALLVEWKQS